MELDAKRLIQDDSAWSRGQGQDYIDESRELDEFQRRDALPEDYPERMPDAGDFQFSTRIASARIGGIREEDTYQVKRDKKRRWWRRAAVNAVLIAMWYLFSTLLSVYNKWMFSPEHYGFSFPLFVTTFHMIIQFILSGAVLSLVPRFRPKVHPTAAEFTTKAGPCGVATGLDIGLSNLALKTVTLSFYTMCKSSSLGFVLIFAFFFKLEKPTWRLVGIIALITLGVVLMVSGETQFSLIGMIEVLSASCMSGLRWALTQKLLDKEAMGLNNPFATLFWLCPIMALTLASCSLIIEGPFQVFASDKFWGGVGATLRTAMLICAPGGLAFLMTTTEFALIQRTSVVTLSVAGIFKETATIFVSTTIFHDQLTPINVSGLCISIFGIALYNYLKFREFTSVKPASPTSPKDGDFLPVPNGQTPYSDPSNANSKVDLGHLSMYNPANATDESAMFMPPGDEVQHTIFGDSDDESDLDDGRPFRKDAQSLGREIEGFREQIGQGEDVRRAEAEEHLLERELETPGRASR